MLRTLLIPHFPHGWRRRIFPSVATSRPAAQESVGRDEALPSGDREARRYRDTLQNVFSFNPNMDPQDVPVDNVFGVS